MTDFTRAAIERATEICPKDHSEQNAFEAWASAQRYNMDQHPLHWLFLDGKTDAARAGWRGALNYVRKILLDAPLETPASTDEESRTDQVIEAIMSLSKAIAEGDDHATAVAVAAVKIDRIYAPAPITIEQGEHFSEWPPGEPILVRDPVVRPWTREASAQVRDLHEANNALEQRARDAENALRDVLPYAEAAIGLPRASWPTDSVILRAEEVLSRGAKG